jgi:hypothetical protein
MKTAYVIYFVAFLTVVALMVVGSAGDWLPQDLPESLVSPAQSTLRESIAYYLRWMAVIMIVPMPFICLIAWWRYHRRHNRVNYPKRRGRVMQLPDNLPAPLVSVLKSREVSDRTLLTIVLDMCSKGSLELHGGVSLGGRYYLGQSGEPEHDWERSILDSLPRGRFEPQELKNQLKRHTSDISKQMDDYVQRIGWFDGGPLAGKYSGSSEKMSGLFALGAMLAGIGFGMWTVWYWPWWASCLTGLAFGVVHLAVGWLAQGAATSDLPPTELGQREISRWRQCQRWLKDVSPAARPQEHERLLPYAVALDVAKPWFFSRHPSWFAVLGEDPEPVWEFRQSMKFHEFIVDDAWDLAGRPHRGGGGGGGDSGGGG